MRRLTGTATLAYRRRASPLHAASGPVAAAYGGALAVCALLTLNPLVLGALLVAVLAAGACAGCGHELVRYARVFAVPIFVLTVVVNVLVSRQGLTVFARLGDWGVLGQVNLTLEALVYGVVFALRLLVVALACMLVVSTANPDELLLSFRRVAPGSALTVALTTRLIPVLAADARRLAEAQRCRPGRQSRGVRARLTLVRATVAGALDRALDVAAVLEMRGYGADALRRRRAGRAVSRSRHDVAFALAASALVALSVLALVTATSSFQAYPLVRVPFDAGVLSVSSLVIVLALVPFIDRRGIEP